MKVLFIIRGKKGTTGVPFIVSQMHSLESLGIKIDIFRIQGNGLQVYFTQAWSLRKLVRKNKYDILHAHYSLCGLTALLALTGKPIVVSMMGSDVLGEFIRSDQTSLRSKIAVALGWIVQLFAARLIAKSSNIYSKLLMKKKALIIPNGVDMELFKPEPKGQSKSRLGLEITKSYVLVLANPGHPWKNVPLAQAAIKMIHDPRIELLIPFPLEPSHVAIYLNAADVLVHPSFMEGSSNVLKEAMACNCPVVATAVGDAAWLLGNTEGCSLSGFDVKEMNVRITEALDFVKRHDRTNGRARIESLGLTLGLTAFKIKEVYEEVLK